MLTDVILHVDEKMTVYLNDTMILTIEGHWRRQLWRTGARALLDFQLLNFSGQFNSEPHNL